MNRRFREILSVLFVAAVAVGGFFQPLVGFGVAAMLILALVMNFNKPRSFCSSACPRGTALGFALSQVSLRRPMPPFMRTDRVRRVLCAFMMICVIGSAFRLRSDMGGLGAFFWGLCIVSLSAGVLLGIIFKPRAWCAVCPMGTLQDTLAMKKKNVESAK